MMKKMYRIIGVALILLGMVFGMLGCANRPPELEEIYDRVVELIENSYELNEVFFGKGLPYYDRHSDVYASMYNDYTIVGYTKDYNIVSRNAKFHSIEEIKQAAALVYSDALLKASVYPAVFDGLMEQNVATGSTYLQARYIEDNENLYILIEDEDAYHPTPLVFDYATMEIIRPSNATRVLISMNVWEENHPEAVFEMQLSIVNENGVWLLDKLTV